MRQAINFLLDLDNIDPEGLAYMSKWALTAFLSLAAASFPVLLLWFGTHLLG